MDELDIFLIVYLISFIKACNILEILPVQPRRAVDQPRGRGKDQAFQVEEHSLHIQHVSENKQTNKRKRMTKKHIYSMLVISNKQTSTLHVLSGRQSVTEFW